MSTANVDCYEIGSGPSTVRTWMVLCEQSYTSVRRLSHRRGNTVKENFVVYLKRLT